MLFVGWFLFFSNLLQANSCNESLQLSSLSQEQRQVALEVVTWMKDHNGRFPNHSVWKNGEIKTGYSKIFGKNHGRLPLGVFGGFNQAWLTIKSVATEEGLTIRLLDLNLRSQVVSEEMRAEWKKELVEVIVDWMVNNGSRMPAVDDFGAEPGKINFDAYRAFGQYLYSEGGRLYNYRIFSSRREAWIALKIAAERKFQDLKIGVPKADSLSSEQAQAIGMVLSWMKTHDGRMPITSDFGTGPNLINLTSNKLFGTGNYREGSKLAHVALFPNPQTAWLALKKAAQREGLNIELFRIKFRGSEVSEELREVWKKELTQVILDWMRRNTGKTPDPTDFGDSPGQIPVFYARAFGMFAYGPGRPHERFRIFSSRIEAWTAILEEAREHEIPINLRTLDLKSSEIPQAVKEKIDTDIIEHVVDWIQKHHGVTPAYSDFGDGPEQIHVPALRVFGRGPYSVGEKQEHLRLAPTTSDVWLKIKAAAAKRGVAVRLTEVLFDPNEVTPELRQEWRKELFEMVHAWMIENQGRRPRYEDFGYENSQIPIYAARVFGFGTYSGEKKSRTWLFENPLEGWIAISESLKSRHLSINLLSLFGEFSNRAFINLWSLKQNQKVWDAWIEAIREDASDIIIRWMLANKRVPKREDFGQEENQVPLDYARLFAFGKFSQEADFNLYSVYPSSGTGWSDIRKRVAAKTYLAEKEREMVVRSLGLFGE